MWPPREFWCLALQMQPSICCMNPCYDLLSLLIVALSSVLRVREHLSVVLDAELELVG